MELPHAAGLVIVGPEALRMLAGSPATATDGMHGERTEFIEGEAAVGEGGGHLLDAVQLGVAEWVVGLLPRLGPLEGDLVFLEDLSEPLPADHPLWSEPRCLITPHTANTVEMAEPLLRTRVAENVRRWIAGEALLGPVDPASEY